jgi:hypothetical protein
MAMLPVMLSAQLLPIYSLAQIRSEALVKLEMR